jgi:hypothetical protein
MHQLIFKIPLYDHFKECLANAEFVNEGRRESEGKEQLKTKSDMRLEPDAKCSKTEYTMSFITSSQENEPQSYLQLL